MFGRVAWFNGIVGPVCRLLDFISVLGNGYGSWKRYRAIDSEPFARLVWPSQFGLGRRAELIGWLSISRPGAGRDLGGSKSAGAKARPVMMHPLHDHLSWQGFAGIEMKSLFIEASCVPIAAPEAQNRPSYQSAQALWKWPGVINVRFGSKADIRAAKVMSALPRKRTCASQLGMSAKCQ